MLKRKKRKKKLLISKCFLYRLNLTNREYVLNISRKVFFVVVHGKHRKSFSKKNLYFSSELRMNSL